RRLPALALVKELFSFFRQPEILFSQELDSGLEELLLRSTEVVVDERSAHLRDARHVGDLPAEVALLVLEEEHRLQDVETNVASRRLVDRVPRQRLPRLHGVRIVKGQSRLTRIEFSVRAHQMRRGTGGLYEVHLS